MLKLIGLGTVVYVGWITGIIQAMMMISAAVLVFLSNI